MDKVVVITGASGGLGKAIADLYRAGGDRVCGLSRSACDEEKDEYRCDVTDEAQVNAAVDKIAAKYGRIDVVINNAGAGMFGTAELAPMSEIKRIMDISYFGSLFVTRACLKHMDRGGRIAMICSISAMTVTPYHSAYCAAKAAQLMLGESLYMELKPAGISVVTICPGEISTGFTANKTVYADTNARYLGRVDKAASVAASRADKRMSVEKAAKKIYDICRKGKKAIYIVGGKYKFFRLAQRLTTDTSFLSLTSHFAS